MLNDDSHLIIGLIPYYMSGLASLVLGMAENGKIPQLVIRGKVKCLS